MHLETNKKNWHFVIPKLLTKETLYARDYYKAIS